MKIVMVKRWINTFYNIFSYTLGKKIQNLANIFWDIFYILIKLYQLIKQKQNSKTISPISK